MSFYGFHATKNTVVWGDDIDVELMVNVKNERAVNVAELYHERCEFSFIHVLCIDMMWPSVLQFN